MSAAKLRPVAAGLLFVLGAAVASAAAPAFKKAATVEPAAAEKTEIASRAAALGKALAGYRSMHPPVNAAAEDLYADVAVCQKAADWILRHGEFYNKNSAAQTLTVLGLGEQRMLQLAGGKHPWSEAKGSLARGYLSKVDGSIQPYVVIVPNNYTGEDRVRLDVVLHGRNGTITEATFLNGFEGKPAPADQPGLVLHVFGRTNNAYRWAGESDVFEAIAAVKRNYRVDDCRVVLRGFSMGGAGAWHLGLHHPGTWVSVEAGAGFSETRKYTKLKEVPDYIAKGLHIYDATDYALNAFNLPVVGYGGENDAQLQASVNVREALAGLGVPMKTEGLLTRAEGMDFLHVVGAKVEHKVDPESAKLLRAFHNERAAKGRSNQPKHIRFVTYTLKYNEAAWLTVEALQEHYKRAAVEAEIKDDAVVVKAENVAILSIDRGIASKVRFGDEELPLADAARGLLPEVFYRNVGGKWEVIGYDASRRVQENADGRKRHNVQGPVDDAFTRPFLCVRGTGSPWNPAVQKWADARLARFAADWDKWMRGTLTIKNDSEVTADDMEGKNLILFGDPGSNSLIAKWLKELPLTWSKTEVGLAGQFAAADHVPVLIAPNPDNPHRYVVINSGHTFGAKEFAGTNALLYPRLGDYAVIRIAGKDDEVKVSGFFGEDWKLK